MLTLEVEFLTGVCFAAQSQSSEQPDWPPQPDRLFSALVASWGARGENNGERKALEWLEQQPAPLIRASEHDARRVGISYVPPNDVGDKVEALPDRRKRQPRAFPAAVPEDPSIEFHWSAEPDTATFEMLRVLARDTSYLGHSASLVRCEFLLKAPPGATLRPPKRQVHAGRLGYLVREYEAGRRPLAGELATAVTPSVSSAPGSVFSRDWMVFEDNGGDHRPDLRGFAVMAKRVRDALMSTHGNPVPEWLSGHLPGGAPTTRPHLAIVPLADAGFQHSEGRLMGFALILPLEQDAALQQARRDWLDGLAAEDPFERFTQALARLSHLHFGKEGVWAVARTMAPAKSSLQPDRYTRACRHWASVTPVVLDRYPKAKGAAWDDEVAEIVAQACANIGLPKPVSVRAQKHSSLRGAPGAMPSGNAPAWTGWTLPGALAQRVLSHVELEFTEPVHGPVLLGAGRFVGLGLCVALGDRR